MSGQLHRDLILAAAAWLKRKHSVIITDMVSGAGEIPDAIGFGSQGSTLIECKASRGDFKADAHKMFRHKRHGMGNARYYMAPEGMIKAEELPEDWGLLEVNAKGKTRELKKPLLDRCDSDREVRLLLSAIRRIGQNPPEGISVKVYTLETLRSATIGIAPAESPNTNVKAQP